MRRCLDAGFTLIELMMAVVIVAILAAVAIPSYNEYIFRSRIPEATTELASLRVRLEQYFQDNRTYVGACTEGTIAPLPPATANFTYRCPILEAAEFEVRATGNAGSQLAGVTFIIDHNNQRRTVVPSAWGTPNRNCWITRRGDLCS